MSQIALLMKPENIVIALVLIDGGVSLSAVAQWPAIFEQQVAPAEIDAAPTGQRRTRQPSPVPAISGPDELCRLLIPPGRGRAAERSSAYFTIAFRHASHTLAGVAGMSM